MAVKIRLTRMGDKKSPFYRIVVADSRKARDGEYIDLVGTYNPIAKNENEIVKLDTAKAQKWIDNGAQPTDTVKALLKKGGVEKAKKAPAKKAPAKKAEPAAKKAPAKKATTKKATAPKAE